MTRLILLGATIALFIFGAMGLVRGPLERAPLGSVWNVQYLRPTEHAGARTGVTGSWGPPGPTLTIASPTNPDPDTWYDNQVVSMILQVPQPETVIGYGYVIDHTPDGEAPREVSTTDQHVTVSDLADGIWYFHVRAQSVNGTWGATTTRAIRLDRVPLTLGELKFSAYTFNPRFFTQNLWFSVSKGARVAVRIESAGKKVVRTIEKMPVAAGRIDVAWDGRDDSGSSVPDGAYVYRVVAVDDHAHSVTAAATGLGITHRRVVVSLSKQTLTALDDDAPVFASEVTTGNAELPTPVGVFPILAKYHPFTFHSPWPKGHPFHYDDAPVSYAMLFDNDGYFIHDAPWRREFGPGSNAAAGTPGQDLTGTHGCVNVPPAIAERLYNWAPSGTAVQVVP